jgi:hypothetical protein
MFRILGFILGSAVSIAAIFMVLGVPEVHLPSAESDQARFDAALEKIRERQAAVEGLVGTTDNDELPTEIPAESVANEVEETIFPVAESYYDPASEPLTEPQDLYNPEQRWHEFWNPFRSEIAARGFVSQLEKVTGLDYRVMKVKAGVYQVGFSYSDDDERRIKLSQISAATGLDLPQT